MTLADRIKAELDRLHDTDTFSIAAYELLTECLANERKRSEDTKTVASLVEDIERANARLQATTYGRKQA